MQAAQRDDMTTYMLIGTKTDLETKRVVSTTMAQQKALVRVHVCPMHLTLCLCTKTVELFSVIK